MLFSGAESSTSQCKWRWGWRGCFPDPLSVFWLHPDRPARYSEFNCEVHMIRSLHKLMFVIVQGIASLLGTIGGTLGLWIGASIFTILEFIIYFFQILSKLVQSIYKKATGSWKSRSAFCFAFFLINLHLFLRHTVTWQQKAYIWKHLFVAKSFPRELRGGFGKRPYFFRFFLTLPLSQHCKEFI